MEQEVGEASVAEIFKRYGEGFFRDKEVSDEACDLIVLHICEVGGSYSLLYLMFWFSNESNERWEAEVRCFIQ